MPKPLTTGVDRSQLHQIIAGLTEGVILIEPDQRITWANAAALAMHGAADLAELGGTVTAYRETFVLRYRNNHVITRTPIERVMAGETFDEVIVNVPRTDRPDFDVMQRIRSLVITDRDGRARLPRADPRRRHRAIRGRGALREDIQRQSGARP